jgi:hypothetical protein
VKVFLAGSKESPQLIYLMKHALALILACCALVAQDKPAAEAPKPAAEAPKPAAVEKPASAKPKIQPINVRDELIELIHQLKKQARSLPSQPSMGGHNPQASAVMHDAQLKAKTEAQRLLLQALVELAKEAERKKPTEVYHSSTPPESFLD